MYHVIFQSYDESIKNVGENKMGLPQYLSRPTGRITEYINILKEFMKYRYVNDFFTCLCVLK